MAATTVYGKLRDRLLATPAVATMVGTRIYPMRLPQNPTLPAITYMLVSSNHVDHMGGSDGTGRFRYQVTAIGRTYTEVQTLAEAIRTALHGWSDRAIGIQASHPITTLDIDDEDVSQYRVPGDYFIWATEQVPA